MGQQTYLPMSLVNSLEGIGIICPNAPYFSIIFTLSNAENFTREVESAATQIWVSQTNCSCILKYTLF
jgi:hypothetical protein